MTPDTLAASGAFMRTADRLPTLYGLADDYNHLVALLEDPEADQAAVQAELERVAGDIKAKAYGLAIVIQSFENRAAMLKTEEQRLAAKRKASEAHAERLKNYAMAQMVAMGEDRIDTGVFTLSVCANSMPKVTVLDAAAVPHEYEKTVITVTVDKTAIGAHFTATGEIVPGVDVAVGTHLRIS